MRPTPLPQDDSMGVHQLGPRPGTAVILRMRRVCGANPSEKGSVRFSGDVSLAHLHNAEEISVRVL